MLRAFVRHPLIDRFVVLLVAFLVLSCAAFVARPLERGMWEAVQQEQVEMDFQAIEATLGEGLAVSILGGFRVILADLVWLRLNAVWEDQEWAKLSAMIRLVTILDPQTEFFWINSARMIAYDVPSWRIRSAGADAPLSKSQRATINLQQAEEAFILLHRALEFHPDSARLPIEIAQIYMNRLKDDAQAAKWFLKASQLPNVPEFTHLIYAELLCRQRKEIEAYQYLTHLYRSLKSRSTSQQALILARIRHLEEQLAFDLVERFQPPYYSLVEEMGQ